MTAIAERYDTPSLPQMGAGLISVLIVDDDPDAVDELSEALEGFGFRCFQAASPDEAIQVIDEEPRISAIVTDFYLRGLATSADNGLLLIERVRETFPDRSFDCVVVSGDPDILAECALSGAVKFLAKPILPESLTAMLLTPARPAQPGPQPPRRGVGPDPRLAPGSKRPRERRTRRRSRAAAVHRGARHGPRPRGPVRQFRAGPRPRPGRGPVRLRRRDPRGLLGAGLP